MTGFFSSKLSIFLVSLIGGSAVIGSYIYGIATHPGQGNDLWGGIPEGVRTIYTVSMLLSAVGYLLFFFHILFRVDPAQVALPGGRGYAFFHVPFLLILLPSAFWMTLTFQWLANPATGTWIATRLVLFTVAFGSVLMTYFLAQLKTTAPEQFWWPAVLGAAWFTFHTLILDAIVWPILFPR